MFDYWGAKNPSPLFHTTCVICRTHRRQGREDACVGSSICIGGNSRRISNISISIICDCVWKGGIVQQAGPGPSNEHNLL